MVELITDRASAHKWRDVASVEEKIRLTVRAAQRMLPGLFSDAVTSSDWLDLVIVRALLTAEVATRSKSEETVNAAMQAANMLKATLRHEHPSPPTHGAYIFADTAHNAVTISAGHHQDERFTYESFDPRDPEANHAIFLADGSDAEVMAGGDIDKVFRQPLWPNAELPSEHGEPFQTLTEKWGSNPGRWGFWQRWYDGLLIGEPIDWTLQREVGLIPDEFWEDGPEAVTEEIAKIDTRFELETRIAELEAGRTALLVDRHGVGGNIPPEPINDDVPKEVVQRIVVVWDAIDTLKEEAAKEAPDAARFNAAVAVIGAALKAILNWTAGKADLSVDTLIKWGIPAGCGYLVLHPEKLQAVYEAAKAFTAAWF